MGAVMRWTGGCRRRLLTTASPERTCPESAKLCPRATRLGAAHQRQHMWVGLDSRQAGAQEKHGIALSSPASQSTGVGAAPGRNCAHPNKTALTRRSSAWASLGGQVLETPSPWVCLGRLLLEMPRIRWRWRAGSALRRRICLIAPRGGADTICWGQNLRRRPGTEFIGGSKLVSALGKIYIGAADFGIPTSNCATWVACPPNPGKEPVTRLRKRPRGRCWVHLEGTVMGTFTRRVGQ